jgi:hypothetical protein
MKRRLLAVHAVLIVVLLSAGISSAVTPRTVLTGSSITKVKALKGSRAELPPGPSNTWIAIPDLQLTMPVPAGTKAFLLIHHNGLPLSCQGYATCKIRIAMDGAPAGFYPEGCANQATPGCLSPMIHGPLNAGGHTFQVQVYRSPEEFCLPSTCAEWELNRYVGPYEIVVEQVKI